MAKMSLYEKLLSQQKKITLLDLFSGIKEKHNGDDMENALLAGTASDRAASESAMIQKWKAPWMFFVVLIMSVATSVLSYLLAKIIGHTAFFMLAFIVPSFVVPITLMVFFWELNVPRNISFFQLMLCFSLGGVFSLVATYVFNIFGFQLTESWGAPLAEEPGKLVIVLLAMKWFSRKKGFKIYGMTGLTLGAAVGAGFAAFESAYYVFSDSLGAIFVVYTNNLGALFESANMHYEAGQNMGVANYLLYTLFPSIEKEYIITTIVRFFFALTSHTLYCAFYSTAAALAMKEHKYNLDVLGQKGFWLMFLLACAMHSFHNSGLCPNIILLFFIELGLEWWIILVLIRKCFAQIASEVHLVGTGSVLATNLKLKCISGAHAGRQFAMKSDSILIGTNAVCNLVYPMGTKGVSDRHCKLIVQNGGLYLADAGSLDGTFLNGVKLKPLMGQLLKKGDYFWLGSENEKYVIE